MSRVYWLPQDSPDARPPDFHSLLSEGVTKVGGIFYPISKDQGVIGGQLPLATLYAALQDQCHPGQEVELWIRLPRSLGSTVQGHGPLTDLSRRGLLKAMMAWKEVVLKDLKAPVPIKGVFMDPQTSPLNPNGVGVGIRRVLGVAFGLLGDSTILASPLRADVYLGKAYTVSAYDSGTGTFPLGSPTAFEACSTRDYCRTCSSGCTWPSGAQPDQSDCLMCKTQCLASRAYTGAKDEDGERAHPEDGGRAGLSNGHTGQPKETLIATLDSKALVNPMASSMAMPMTSSVPMTSSMPTDNVNFNYMLPPSIVPPSTPLSFKYGATIAMSRWYHGMKRNPGSGPIMACYLSRDCALDKSQDEGCNILSAYQGFMTTYAKTKGRPSGIPVCFLV